MNWLKNKKIVITHDGNFHPDDVFAVATISLLNKGKIKVIRSRDYSLYEKADYVLDTGDVYDPVNDRFDHHQEGGAGKRDNGILYSTFGLVWQKYGEQLCGSKNIAKIIDNELVEVIDADDCGFELCDARLKDVRLFPMVDVIYAYSPTWKEDDSRIYDLFMGRVEFAKALLARRIKVWQDKIEAGELVDKIYQSTADKRVIVFDQVGIPKSLLLKYPEPLFVVYPNRGTPMWRVKTLEKDENTIECRKNFPKAWWGKRDEDLAKVCGVSDATFVRNTGIFGGAKSKEGALKMAELAVNNKE